MIYEDIIRIPRVIINAYHHMIYGDDILIIGGWGAVVVVVAVH
jgi:hypothetical protein